MKISFDNTKLTFSLVLLVNLSTACSKKNTTTTQTTSKVDNACASLTTPTLLALAENSSPFFDYAQNIIRDLVPEPIEVRIDQSSFISRGGAQHLNFNFSLSGIPLCQFQARVHSLKDKTYVDGTLPNTLVIGTLPEPINYEESDSARILSALNIKGTPEHITNTSCLTWDGVELSSALEVEFKIKELPYYALITKNNILRAEARFFDLDTVTVQTKIDVKTPITSTNLVLNTITLTGMSSGGSLCNARFKTVVPDTVQKAFSTNNQFFFNTDDQRFKETSLFTNANTHADWFLSLGILKAWPGPKVDLLMDGTNNFFNNSSVFIPAKGTTVPTIKIGAGDGTILQNLYIDYDVISHELGHHIVYQTLKTTTGESLVIHEGLADYFVFGNTKYPCLGNLICPPGSTLCYSATCLRTGLFPLNYGDAGLPSEAHKLSQVISSLLWDIGNGNTANKITGIGVDVTTKDVLKAVDFLPSNAGYTDFISSLMKADKALNNSTNCTTIEKAAVARGFSSALASANVSCATVQ